MNSRRNFPNKAPTTSRSMAYRFCGHISQIDDVLSTVGEPLLIRGERYLDGRGDPREAVVVESLTGSAKFTGAEWGYDGEFTRPVVELLVRLGVHLERAENVVFMSRRYDDTGVDWIIKFLPGDRLLVLDRDQLEALSDLLSSCVRSS